MAIKPAGHWVTAHFSDDTASYTNLQIHREEVEALRVVNREPGHFRAYFVPAGKELSEDYIGGPEIKAEKFFVKNYSCPFCGAMPSFYCTTKDGDYCADHSARVKNAKEQWNAAKAD